jgi:hypothetical protein
MNKPLDTQNEKSTDLSKETGEVVDQKPGKDKVGRITDKISEEAAPKSPQDMYPLW